MQPHNDIVERSSSEQLAAHHARYAEVRSPRPENAFGFSTRFGTRPPRSEPSETHSHPTAAPGHGRLAATRAIGPSQHLPLAGLIGQPIPRPQGHRQDLEYRFLRWGLRIGLLCGLRLCHLLSLRPARVHGVGEAVPTEWRSPGFVDTPSLARQGRSTLPTTPPP